MCSKGFLKISTANYLSKLWLGLGLILVASSTAQAQTILPIPLPTAVKSREHFVSASQCQTIDLEGLCDDDAGSGCELHITLYNTANDQVRGHMVHVRMQSPTLQGNDGFRRITLGNDVAPLLSSAVLGKAADAVSLYNPWNLAFLQNGPQGCPLSYLPPTQNGPTFSRKSYVSTNKLTLRASANWHATLLVKKLAAE